MGRRGPLPKPPERAQGHRRRADLVVHNGGLDHAEPPEGLSGAVAEAWHAYWRSDVAKVATEVDLPALRRLFGMYDQYERAMDIARRALVVKGSTGQIRVNPLADHALKLEGQILRLENELGLTPMARQRLGIAVGEALLTLEQLNRALEERDGDRGEEEDPRLHALR